MTTTQTANYGLVKPTAGSGEPVSVQAHLDDNWDKIDQDMNRFDEQRFTASGTWNKPARCRFVEVQVIGAGGSGGGTTATGAGQSACGGGGGGGSYAKKLFAASALAASETVTIGAGGAAAGAAGAGNIGGSSIFAVGKAYIVTAAGGNGGAVGNVGGNTAAAPGAGGAATGGDINIDGSDGGPGVVIAGVYVAGNFGGNSHLSGLATIQSFAVSPTVGRVGHLYGGGSSGALAGASAASSGSTAGAAGIVIVRNYY